VTGEQRLVRIDLSEAYAAVRRRSRALRRRRIITSILATLILGAVFSVVSVYYVNSIPLPDGFSLPATTTVYYSDGSTVMARLGSQRRAMVNIANLPEYVRNAVLAAEDPGFFSDSSALISRQYARVATGLDSSDGLGKARLLVLGWKLEDTYSKEQILEFYLNTVYFGRGAYGIEAAAQAYFGSSALNLTVAQAIVLADLIASPGDGEFDPTVNAANAQRRFEQVSGAMVRAGALAQSIANGLRLPEVNEYDPGLFESDLDLPTGLVVQQVLAELGQTPAFHGKPPGYIENGGYRIVTTVDPKVQNALEQAADSAVNGSLMHDQPDNLQAAAAVVEPGTGRVLGYFGGHDGTGADYAGSYTRANGTVGGFGVHPPAQTMDVYTMAAALESNISVQSTWKAPESRQLPGTQTTVQDVLGAACQPICTLTQAANSALRVPFVGLTEKVGPAAVVDAAKAAGIASMWLPPTDTSAAKRFDLAGQSGAALTPQPFGPAVGQGTYPVSVLDQANAMATFADAGRRSQVHFVQAVTKNAATIYATPDAAPVRAFAPATVDDLSWALSQNPSGQLPGGRVSASQTGSGLLRTSLVETAHAWAVGYTANLAMAVWVGNVETELPLRDELGIRVTGDTLPAQLYRTVMDRASAALALPMVAFPAPAHGGDVQAGDAGSG
jgi:membrane peptidoglycan carboxypeptidase